MKLNPDTVAPLIHSILESDFYLHDLKSMEAQCIVHDDADGKDDDTLFVMMSPDGDARIWTSKHRQALRFRTAAGGGKSHRTRVALMILAEAIRLDCEKPMQ